MSIPFTQFMMPDGRRKPVWIVMPPEVEAKAQKLIQDGCRFEIEMLGDGQISMTCERGEDDEHEVLAAELVPNGPEVPPAVDRMIAEATQAALPSTLRRAVDS